MDITFFDKARVYQVHSQPVPHAIFQIGVWGNGSPELVKIKLGYKKDLDAQAHVLVNNLPIEFFVVQESG